jgi:hypothetical protein
MAKGVPDVVRGLGLQPEQPGKEGFISDWTQMRPQLDWVGAHWKPVAIFPTRICLVKLLRCDILWQVRATSAERFWLILSGYRDPER